MLFHTILILSPFKLFPGNYSLQYFNYVHITALQVYKIREIAKLLLENILRSLLLQLISGD